MSDAPIHSMNMTEFSFTGSLAKDKELQAERRQKSSLQDSQKCNTAALYYLLTLQNHRSSQEVEASWGTLEVGFLLSLK